MTFRVFIFPVLVAVYAALLPLIWSHIVRSTEQATYNDGLVRGLKIEMSQNLAAVNNIKGVLEHELELLEQNQFELTPLLDFRFEAWNQAKTGPGNFLEKVGRTDTAGFYKLTYCYTVLNIVQQKVRNREMYRYLHEGRAGFAERMKQLDRSILSILDRVQEIVSTAQVYLYTIHDWKVKGESFTVEVGLVKMMSDAIAQPSEN